MRGRYSFRQEYGFTSEDYAEYKRIRERMTYADHGSEVIRLKKMFNSGVVHIKRFFERGYSKAETKSIMLEVLDGIFDEEYDEEEDNYVLHGNSPLTDRAFAIPPDETS
tara:strand:- start:1896 stop:2222 length:327 start_codon:yes stop_codon:yes gene_type:complete